MRHADRDRAIVAAAICIGVAGLILAPLRDSLPFSVVLYGLAATLATFELADIGLRVFISRGHRSVRASAGAVTPLTARSTLKLYAIVVPVHNIRRSADEILRTLEPYKARTWIVDDASTDDTALRLRSAGWRCFSTGTNRKKPGAVKFLLERLPKEVRTVVVLDPDSAPLNSAGSGNLDFEKAIARFQNSDAAACCPRIRYREDGPLVSLQLLECEIAFSLGRKGLSPYCVTSGVSLYDRASLQDALAEHSLSVYAEDLENSILLLGQGLEIEFDDDLVIETDGKFTVATWFSQRVGWSFGLIRVYVAHWRQIVAIGKQSPWAFYNFAVYIGLLGIILFPIKLAGVIVLTISFLNALDNLFALRLIADNALTNPAYFSTVYLTYTGLMAALVSYLRVQARPTTIVTAVAFYFFYAAVNAIATAVGFLNWIGVRLIGRRVFRDHYSASCQSLGRGTLDR